MSEKNENVEQEVTEEIKKINSTYSTVEFSFIGRFEEDYKEMI